MKKVFKTAARIFGFLIISIFIGYGIFLMNAKFVLHEHLPMIGGYGNAVVLSGSMEPEISVNDMIIIKQENEYKVNDIITFIDADNSLVTHRIIKISGTEITTQGDANNIRDSSIQIEQVKGKVIAIWPRFGYIITFIQNPFFIITIIVLTLILMERSYTMEKKKKATDIETLKAEIEALKKESITPNSENKVR